MFNVLSKGAWIGCWCVVSAACGSESAQWVQAPPPTTGTQKFIGCIGPTGLPNRFVLSVSEGRNATYGDPPGTIVPQPAALPPGAPPPITPPAGSIGLPGDGADSVTKIVAYNLIGNGGLNLNAHIGHTVEIVGDVQELPEADRVSRGEADKLMRQLQVGSARHVADQCLGDP